MKIAEDRTIAQQTQRLRATLTTLPSSDLSNKPNFPRNAARRKGKGSAAGVRVKGRSSRPETPLLKWKFDESNDRNKSALEEEKSFAAVGRKNGRQVISARKLGAGIWRLHLKEFQNNGGVRLGLQPGDGNLGAPIHDHHVDRMQYSPANNLIHNPLYVALPKHGIHHKQFDPAFQLSNTAMEGATKWDPVGAKASDELNQIFGQTKILNQHRSDAPIIRSLEAQLEQARARISELETERRSSKKKLEQFLQKLSEERNAWRSREHEKIRAIMDDLKSELSREKKNRQRLETVNSKLINELTDAKLSIKRCLQEYEKERKARMLVEEVCDELAKEIGEDKAEVETLKHESRKLWEEVEEERKMLQMAEVWREERAQMKLVDAKVMLEEKYSQMNGIIEDLEAFLKSKYPASDFNEMKKSEFLKEIAASVNMQDIRELTYKPTNPDDIFSVCQDMDFGQPNKEEIETHDAKNHSATHEVQLLNRQSTQRQSYPYMDQSSELEEDASEWETVSHAEDQGSSYSPDGSDPSVRRSYRTNNVSRERERNGEETPTMEINEVGSAQPRLLKKASSISRLWRSCPSNGDIYKIASVEGVNKRLSNGRFSNVGAVMSPDCSSGEADQDMAGQWSSPDSRNQHLPRGAKGCMEWPRSGQKSSLKARLLEARIESQKLQLRQVLKQKI